MDFKLFGGFSLRLMIVESLLRLKTDYIFMHIQRK